MKVAEPQADSVADFSQKILCWYRKHGRHDLPWQHHVTPYRVWVSEVMLQQTQVSTVIPYFERFMASFPTVFDLAEASQDAVLRHWTGLGYYARARNLHRCARTIVEDFSGQFPDTVDALSALPGIGRSTAGAILSLAMDRRAPILDGNVKRVLCRYHCVPGWPGRSATSKRLWELAEHHTPHQSFAEYTQAIMDLGATLCTRSRPRCDDCPIHRHCQARLQGVTADYPNRKPARTLPQKRTAMLLLESPDKRVLLERRPEIGIWGGLWSLPEYDDVDTLHTALADIDPSATTQTAPVIKHSFSHFHLEITPVLARLQQTDAYPGSGIRESDHQCWHAFDDIGTLGMAAPIKKLLQLRIHQLGTQQESPEETSE